MSERSSREVLRDLETGRLSWDEIQPALRATKTADRFTEYRAALAELTPFGENVLLRLGEYLFVVREPDGSHAVRCGQCQHSFGDPRVNWKLSARVRVRRTAEEFLEVYLYEEVCPEPGVAEVREYYCPGCFTLLNVECVPVGYPPVFEFLPDLGQVYTEFLHQPAPVEDGRDWVCEDRTLGRLREWATPGSGSSAQGGAR